MYESFFQLSSRPFIAAPTIDRYFPASSIEEARQSLTRAIDRAEGPGLLIGPAGTGKTLLCQILARELAASYEVALLASARLCTRRALLQNILFELDLPYRDREEGELRLTLMDYLKPSAECPNGVVLIADEAHTLPLRLLEEIRMISNFAPGGQSRVQLVVAGGTALEERFSSPKLESFNQRIAVRSYLQSFSRQETYEYIRWHLKAAGGKVEQILDESALEATYIATDGIPRLINQVVDHALLLAVANKTKPLTADTIQEAWADLQQLPAPWTPNAKTDSSSMHVIEFGELSSSETTRDSHHSQFSDDELATDVSGDSKIAELKVAKDEPIVESGTADPQPNAFTSTVEDPFVPDVSQPEVELVFVAELDPFGSGFEQEEVVIDRYASLEAESLKSHPHVAGDESEQMAAVIQNESAGSAGPQLSVVGESDDNDAPLDDEDSIEEAIARDVETLKVAALADVLTTENDEHGEKNRPNDDRDIIVIAEPDPPIRRRTRQQDSRRQNYRRLFAKLRNA